MAAFTQAGGNFFAKAVGGATLSAEQGGASGGLAGPWE